MDMKPEHPALGHSNGSQGISALYCNHIETNLGVHLIQIYAINGGVTQTKKNKAQFLTWSTWKSFSQSLLKYLISFSYEMYMTAFMEIDKVMK